MEKFPYTAGVFKRMDCICEIYAIHSTPSRSCALSYCIPVKSLPTAFFESLTDPDDRVFCLKEWTVANWASNNQLTIDVSENITSHFGDECIWVSDVEICLIEIKDIEKEIIKINVELNSQ